MWRRLALSCSICSSMSERVVRRRPFLSMRVLRLAVVGLALSGALPWSSTLALMVGRHFPARDAGLPQPGPSRAAIAAASRLRAAAVDTAVPVIRGPWRGRFFFERLGDGVSRLPCWQAGGLRPFGRAEGSGSLPDRG